jgi:hypothetical protein
MNDKAKQTKNDLKCVCRRSYMLRLWRTDGPGGFNWQASLDIPETGERTGFANLEELFAYLMDVTTTKDLENTLRTRGNNHP